MLNKDVSSLLELLQSIDKSLRIIAGRKPSRERDEYYQLFIKRGEEINECLIKILSINTSRTELNALMQHLKQVDLKSNYLFTETDYLRGYDFPPVTVSLVAYNIQQVLNGVFRASNIGPKRIEQLKKLFDGKLEKWIDSEHAGGYDEESK